MRQRFWALLALMIGGPAMAAGTPTTVSTYHNNDNRNGVYTVPGLDDAAAANATLAKGFQGFVQGSVYAQPLYWRGANAAHGMIIVATEANQVYALDAIDGAVIWHTSLGTWVPNKELPCGNLKPDGVTGTPVIDPTTKTLYVASMNIEPAGPQHLIYALSVNTGAIKPGWPINVRKAAAKIGQTFNPIVQNQRSALSFIGGKLYVGYGGHFGDCGDYHGWVVGIDPTAPDLFAAWSTRAMSGGIWAPGGMLFDGTSVYVATGNTVNATQWADGEEIMRLLPNLAHAADTDTQDYFAAANWPVLDANDLDISGTGPVPLDVPNGSGGTTPFLLGLGKDGNAYLLDRTNLGGIGGALAVTPVSTGKIRTATAFYQTAAGTFVTFQGIGTGCSAALSGLTTLNITASPTPAVTTAWCGALNGQGAPIVTTTDGTSNPIVWVTGAEGDNLLHAYDGVTGQVVFNGGGAADQMKNVHHFSTILVAEGRFYIPADNRIWAFKIPGVSSTAATDTD